MPPAKMPDNLMIIIGQLLEATKAASDGLKSMSQEVQSNAKAIIAASKTLEMVEKKLGELADLVDDSSNPNSLAQVSSRHTNELSELRKAIADLKDALLKLGTEMNVLGTGVAALKHDGVQLTTTKDTVWGVIKFIGWALTTAIALYAALNGK